ncbi:hypothetical protein ACIRRH_35995 [Kitasatospora sp. NPDC101235]|uniref:hypothetical protein n=1 Tax=Kitasatospora sp. NPDC101235 TaxID=3364101 RepID=UPI00381ED3F3
MAPAPGRLTPRGAKPRATTARPSSQPPPAPEPDAVPGQDAGQTPAWRSAAEAAEQARREACTDPERRFDFPDLLDDLEPTFGPGWELGSWLTPDAQGVLQLRHDSTPIGWTAPLPEGPWGQAGWIAVLYQPPGARLLVDTFSRPKTHPTADLALDAILRAHQSARPAPGRTMATGAATHGWRPPSPSRSGAAAGQRNLPRRVGGQPKRVLLAHAAVPSAL